MHSDFVLLSTVFQYMNTKILFTFSSLTFLETFSITLFQHTIFSKRILGKLQ